MKTKKKIAKKQSLAERVKALRILCDRALDEEAEKQRPKGEGGAIPACAMRRQWLAMANNQIEDAYLIATGQL